jgi:autotransporter-associated beta strand protein
MKTHVPSIKFAQKFMSTAARFKAAFFVAALLSSAQAQAQTVEQWTAAADNFTNGADWNPAVTGTPTNWPNCFNGLGVSYRANIINGGTINYVGPSVSDPFDPNWTNTLDTLWIGPNSGASSTSIGTNTFLMMGGTLALGLEASGAPDGGATLAVGGYSVNSISNNAVFTMTGGTLNDIYDAAGGFSDASLFVGSGSNALAVVNLNGGTANFNSIYIAGRGTAIVNINGADVNVNGDGFGNSSSSGTPAYYVLIGFGSSSSVTANGKGAGTFNLISGELDVTNGTGIFIGGRCPSATLNVSGGEIDTPEMQWGTNTTAQNAKVTNTFNLSGGLVNVGSGGLTHDLVETNRLVISGGTFSTLFGQSWSEDGSLNVTLVTSPGPGVATFAPLAGSSITMSSPMSGSGALTAAGPGTLALTGPNTYTGTTTISGGTLAIEAIQPNILHVDITGGNLQIGPGLAGTVDPLPDSPLALPGGTSLIFSNATALAFTNVVTGSGSLLVGGGGAVTNNAANFQSTGGTVINAGDLVLTGSGSSLASAKITIGSGGTLDVSQLPSFNLGAGQVVNDAGALVGGNINFNSGSTLALGLLATNIVFNGPQEGHLTFNSGSTNDVLLDMTNFDAGNYEVAGFSSVTLGGTLALTNIGSPLVAGEIIPLYNAAAYSGSFSSIVPATPGAGLVWDTSQLDTSGTLRVAPSVVNPNAPSIIQQPISTNVTQGTTVADPVVAGGSGLSYQWYQSPGGVLVGGQTSAALTFTPAEPGNSGDYYLVVSNSSGIVVSAIISVSVFPPTQITSQLPITYTNLYTLYAGANPRFSVTATGAPPFYYQWSSNGVVVAGSTNSNFTLTNAQIGMLTNSCVVSNSVGSTASAVWTAQVIADPTNSTGGLAPYPQQVLALNPIGYWRLNDTNLDGVDDNNGDNGFICHDYVGGNDGTYTNVSLAQSGYNPASDPSDDSMFVGNDADGENGDVGDQDANSIEGINFGSPSGTSVAFTVEAWVSGDDQELAGAGIVALGFGGGEQFDLDCGGTSSAFRFFFRDASGGTHTVTSTLVANTVANPVFGPWYHLVAVVDEINSHTVTFYTNGVPVGTAAASAGAGVLASSYTMNIGARSASATTNLNLQFAGLINDVAVFNYALSPSQVANEFDAGGGSIAPYFDPAPPTTGSAAANATLTIPVTAVGTPPMGYWWTNVTTSAGIASGTANNASGNVTLSYPNVPISWNSDQLQLTVTNAYGSTNILFNLAITNGISMTPTNIMSAITNNLLYLSWPANHTGWQLQAQTNKVSVGINSNWANYNPSTTTNQVAIPINLTNGTVFYRLIYTP